jgi:H+-translocating NAD(P) transhydrogenase subunit alpha
MKDINIIAKEAKALHEKATYLSEKILHFASSNQDTITGSNTDSFISLLTIFVLACFIGYYVVWKVTPALHTPLMSITNAISGIIIVGAILTLGARGFGGSQVLGFIAALIASINIFGGFIVTQRMLKMFKKKE